MKESKTERKRARLRGDHACDCWLCLTSKEKKRICLDKHKRALKHPDLELPSQYDS